ncbi:unnamed protein product, partial [Musa hybrid cultivar]
MGRKPCCAKETDLKRGAWTAEEDGILEAYIKTHGEGRWRSLPKKAGLKRCGKSCRLRWLNYLRPDIKRGNISLEEEDLIIRLHRLIGNRYSPAVSTSLIEKSSESSPQVVADCRAVARSNRQRDQELLEYLLE